jgi:hypothetical protein
VGFGSCSVGFIRLLLFLDQPDNLAFGTPCGLTETCDERERAALSGGFAMP